MANIMSMKNVRNKVHRNGFDLSFRNLFTAKVGELLPVMCKEVIPGDKFNINVSSFTRTQPVQTAAFTRLREYYDFYFVPMRLLWDKFPAFITQTNNPTHASSLVKSADVSQMPYMNASDMWDLIGMVYGQCAKLDYLNTNLASNWTNEVGMPRIYGMMKLLHYLGYGDIEQTCSINFASKSGNFNNPITNKLPGQGSSATFTDMALSPFPLLAYQKIYQDYFRFQQWEKTAPYTCNLDYLMSSPFKLNLFSDLAPCFASAETDRYPKYTMFDLRYANYKKDLFTGILPSPQFGDTAVASPIFGNTSGTIQLGSASETQTTFNMSIANGPVDNQNNLGLSIFALRQAEFLQKWREITQSGNLDYREQLEKHWNVRTSRFQSDLCDYLGGTGSNLNINEVVNQTLTDAEQNANIAGKGTGSASGHISREFNEHGILMCIYHCEPLLDWANIGLDRLCTKVTADSYAIPEFDSLGMESLPATDLCFTDGKYQNPYIPDPVDVAFPFLMNFSKFAPLGYVPRYIDYKISKDVVNGSFLSTMKDWVSPLTFDDILKRYLLDFAPGGASVKNNTNVSYETFKINPHVVDSIFAVEANASIDTDQLLIGAFFDCKVVRNLSTDGLPY